MAEGRRPAARAEGFARRWWRGELGPVGVVLDVLLLPAEAIWRVGSALHRGGAGRRRSAPGVPTVSIGNLAVGGAGKTPVAAWVAGELLRRGARPALLHGGYASDEPALHRRLNPDVPVYAGRDRATSARRAVAGGADVLVLDDAFQHHRLARDLDLVLVAAEGWSPRPRMLPRGPWREPPGALRRAHLVLVTRRTASPERAARVMEEVARVAGGVDVALVHLRPARWSREGATVAAPAAPALAVAALADPAAFAVNAGEAGAVVQDLLAFPDHHDYDARDADAIRRAAGPRPIVTSAKDAVKLEPLLGEERLWVLHQEVILEAGGARVHAALDGLVARSAP